MTMNFSDLQCREVICLSDGQRLGFITDVQIEIPDGKVCAIVVPGPCRLFGVAGRSDDYCVPCGTCRQVMMEFAPNMEVLCINKAGDAKKFALKELLPYGFDQTWL